MYLIETKKLKSALERLWLAVPKRGGLPVLENFRWRVVNAQLNLTATDLDNSVLITVTQAHRRDIPHFCPTVPYRFWPESTLRSARNAPFD